MSTLLDTIEHVEAETDVIAARIGQPPPAEPSVNSSFSEHQAGLQLYWDSTSLSALKVCPKYYHYTIVQGLVPRGTSAHLIFGLEFHSALEQYDRERATGLGHRDAMLAAVRNAIVRTWNGRLNRPWTSDEPTKTRETLIRSVVWYLDQFEEDHLRTVILATGQPAVELSFRFETGFTTQTTNEDFWLCGHLDRLVTEGDSDIEWIVDRKTTKSGLGEEYFQRYSPDCQMSLYTLAGNVIRKKPVKGIIIDACQVQVNGSRFQRGFVTRSPAQLEEWFNDTRQWLRLAESYAIAGHWPQNDKACNQYSSYNSDLDTWRGGCPFKPVCGASPEVRPKLLAGLYDHRPWDPRQTREV